MSEFERKVYNETRKIPRGRVSTYARIAGKIKNPLAVRAVGNALNRNPYREVPCHRVVRSDGTVGGFARGTYKKAEHLASEGIEIKGGKIDLLRYLYERRTHS